MKTRIGFIGLGLMGGPMTANLLKAGYPVTVWNRTHKKMEPLVALGATAAGSPRELAARAEIIFTMVTNAPQVREVLLGKDGVIHGAAAGTIVIDSSSIAPSAAREIAEQLATAGIHLLDAPVSGGPEGAAAGTLSIMVGGDHAVFACAQPILEVLGKTVRYVGPQGTGQLVKLCNQVAGAMNMLGMCEAFTLAEKGGADLNVVRELLMGGAAGSWMMQTWGPKIIQRDFRPGFSVANSQKDLRNVLQEAAALHVPLPGVALVNQLHEANEAAGESQEATFALFKVLMRLAGEQI